ncbi:DUF5683 domain-containing protein [Gilvibacter sediminis]|uniref:DUF5683 domain-containing protein n=1 Tax=Gilvibacter sediminis TaxID=379071 RepID=UPI002350551F|nr:DUF5683 domain-containing protein [Gilvibacter sediminis]MDC7998921.1 DUF5683 domain-containing protein [Gilvibacter sediminis]
MKIKYLFLLVFGIATTLTHAQDDELDVRVQDTVVASTATILDYDPLAPSKAAFYSAVLPGLGQAYNKKYWKIPIVYAGIGTGIYFWIQQDQEYDRFRNAFKRRLAGFTDDEFFGDGDTPLVSNDRLIDAQRQAQKNKDISLIVAVAFYLINIVDANVDAHLRQYNINDDLSLTPQLQIDPVSTQASYGLSLRFNFGQR